MWIESEETCANEVIEKTNPQKQAASGDTRRNIPKLMEGSFR
jgi:hypothetical protein